MKEVRKDVVKTLYRVKPKYAVTYEAIQYDGHNKKDIEEFLGQEVIKNGCGGVIFTNDRNTWDDIETSVQPGQFIVKAYDSYHVVDALEPEYRITEKIVDERHFYTAEEEADS